MKQKLLSLHQQVGIVRSILSEVELIVLQLLALGWLIVHFVRR